MDDRTLTDLVDAITAGEQGAWPELIRRLTPAVQGALRRLDVGDELRSDAAAETWRILFERLDTVREPERLHGWIAVVAVNQLRSLLRRPAERREVTMVDDAFDRIEPVDDPDRVVQDEIRQVLRAAIARLSERERTVIECRAWTDHPVPLEVIGRRHGIPAGSVGPTLGRGLKKLRGDPDLLRFFSDLVPDGSSSHRSAVTS